jgi:hypothetical protein
MAAFVASFLGGQPLLISGVTGEQYAHQSFKALNPLQGPITVFNKTIYDIFEKQANAPNYLHFMGWTYLWAAIFHWVASVCNGRHVAHHLIRRRIILSCAGFEVCHEVFVRYLWILRRFRIRPIRDPDGYQAVSTVLHHSRFFGNHVGTSHQCKLF